MNSLVLQFIAEVRDYLDEAARGFLALEQAINDQAVINGIFRNFHTIKGTSGIFPEFAPITSLTHAAEDLMDRVRNGEREITSEMVDLFLGVLDLLSCWLDNLERKGTLPGDAQADGESLRLRVIALRDESCETPAPADATSVNVNNEQHVVRQRLITEWAMSLSSSDRSRLLSLACTPPLTVSVICYTPDSNCFFYGEDPVNLLRQTSMVEVMSVVLPAPLPQPEELDPFICQLTFLSVVVENPEQLNSIFGYVLEQVTILSLPEALALAEPQSVTLDLGSITSAEPALPEVHPEMAESSRKGGSGYIRVDQVLINRLLDLVGEIIIAKNSLPFLCIRASGEFGVPRLADEIDSRYATISQVVEGLQDVAMDMRMLPVARAFERFPRLVRDISRKLGKQITLVMEGEETRADKDVIEALTEPLVHMVRNSLDHGVEMPEERLAAGKLAEGRITLRALQENSAIVVEISDDGKGINPDVIRRKAEEKGIMSGEVLAALPDSEVIQLVMAPNFSTAEAVSDLSGRGVGMDAVNAMVKAFGGAIHLSSVTGSGTTVRLSLPLSMAITKVLIVRQDGCTFGIPADHVIESLIDVPLEKINTLRGEAGLDVRGELYPLYSLARQLDMGHGDPLFPEKFSAVVVRVRGEVTAIAVEDFKDIIDVMVKPLQGLLAGNPYYSGNTILGDGSIMFILNMPEVVSHAG
jgi:two-component system chemotaxis sensor kinase CheA